MSDRTPTAYGSNYQTIQDAEPIPMPRAYFGPAMMQIARRFEAADGPKSATDALNMTRVLDQVGRLVIAASRNGWHAHGAIDLLVEYHTADGSSDRRPGMQAMLVRGPINLFCDLAGGNMVDFRNEDGRQIIGDHATGGLLPRLYPDQFPPIPLCLGDHALQHRYAAAATWLAVALEAPANWPAAQEQLSESDSGETPAEPVHSEDFTSVVWFGTRYAFSPGNQAEAVRHLWAAHEKGGLTLSERTIGEKIESGSDRFRLAHTFRGHPAWGTMIRKDENGAYRLAEPGIPE